MSESSWEVIVVGGGAAGLLAGSAAASRGRRTLVLEKNRKLGVKILISGGTRCNITHDTDSAGIAAGFPSYQGKFLRSALASFPPERILGLLEDEGVATKVESTGKIFPVSNRAIDVRDGLVSFASKNGVAFASGTTVVSIDGSGEQFQIALQRDGDREKLLAKCVIIACGGQSYSGCGTTGDGYVWARRFGHKIVQPVPALTPIRSSTMWIREHSGVTIPDVELTVAKRSLMSRDSLMSCSIPNVAVADRRRGSVLFTHFGISGPPALDVSRTITRATDRNDLVLLLDFDPSERRADVARSWRSTLDQDGKKTVNSMILGQLPNKFAVSLMNVAGVPSDRRAAELSKAELTRLVDAVKSSVVELTGTLGFDKAEVTAGGVSLDEVNSKTLESKLVPGLYFAGEILDLDGRIGGYNFQAAFSTGWCAGTAASAG